MRSESNDGGLAKGMMREGKGKGSAGMGGEAWMWEGMAKREVGWELIER